MIPALPLELSRNKAYEFSFLFDFLFHFRFRVLLTSSILPSKHSTTTTQVWRHGTPLIPN
jgi:hypothetical protein